MSQFTRRARFRGLPVNVEIEVGEVRRGVDSDGVPWENTYSVPYGEIDGTLGADGDPVDVYLGPNAAAETVFVAHQRNKAGSFDEDKCFLGFDRLPDAVAAYFEHGPAWGCSDFEAVPFDEFVEQYVRNPRYAAPNSLGGPP